MAVARLLGVDGRGVRNCAEEPPPRINQEQSFTDNYCKCLPEKHADWVQRHTVAKTLQNML